MKKNIINLYQVENIGGRKMIMWIIEFLDGNEIYKYREEILDEYEDVIDWGDILYFHTQKQAEDFLKKLDTREFQRWVRGVNR